jgi:hypothetical protein
VQFKKDTGELASRVVELYSKRLDPAKVMLLENEFVDIQTRIKKALADAREGRCTTFDWIQKQQVVWQVEMEAFVRKTLSNEALEIDRTLALQVDPDKRERPKTKAARDAIRKKLLHFQLANYVVSGTKLAEAKKKLIHRYELITKDVRDQTIDEVYSGFLNAFSNALDLYLMYFFCRRFGGFLDFYGPIPRRHRSRVKQSRWLHDGA